MLTNKQIRHLRALAHPLSFLIQTGDKGLSEAVLNEINLGLDSHELIKVKLNAERDERKIMIDSIISNQKCELVQYIGKTIVLFRRNKNNIKIELI